MVNISSNKGIFFASLFILLCGCAPLVPSNYLTTLSIKTPQKANGKFINPQLIPLNAEMLNTPIGRELLLPAMMPQPYRIGPYDNLNIIVWGHPDISTIATAPIVNTNASLTSMTTSINGSTNPVISVETDGTIFYPYVGRMKIAGLTLNEAQASISQRLSKYIINPQVTIQVAKYRNRNIYVLGEVNAQGMQPLTDKPHSLMEALVNAGDINTRSADPTHIYLVLGSYQRPVIFWLNATTPQSLLIAQRFPLQENDIVYVSAAILNPWNNFVNQVLPNFTTYFTIKGLANS